MADTPIGIRKRTSYATSTQMLMCCLLADKLDVKRHMLQTMFQPWQSGFVGLLAAIKSVQQENCSNQKQQESSADGGLCLELQL